MKKIGYSIYTIYNSIFNYRVNPLRNVPKLRDRIVATVVLATMWSIAFGTITGSYVYGVYTWLGHLMVIASVGITVHTFIVAEKKKKIWFLNLKRLDRISKIHDNITKKDGYDQHWNDN